MEKKVYEVKPAPKGIGKWIGLGVGAVLLIIVLVSTVVIIPAGTTGVVLTFGKVSENVMGEGLHLKIPFVQSVVNVSNKIQKLEVAAQAVSQDLQAISSDIAVNYRIGNQASASIYQNIGLDYQNVVLLPAVQESMKSVSAMYTAEELITKRTEVSEEIKETLESKIAEYGIVVDRFNIVNFDFSEEFNAAIEAKQVAEQNLIKTRTEQEQEIVIAEAAAKRKVIEAEAEAEAITARADAQAKANETLTKSLSEMLVEYEKVQKWDGKLPVATGGNTFLDVSSLAGEQGESTPQTAG